MAQRETGAAPKRGSQVEGIEDYVSFAVRDAYSGVCICSPQNSRDQGLCYKNLKAFVGPTVAKKTPQLIVKSDAAPEITGAVHDLGWFAETSLANKWPHNSAHERCQGTIKSVCRASMLQSGFPGKVVNWCMTYLSMILSFDMPCPIHSHERDVAGNVLPEFRYKETRTC